MLRIIPFSSPGALQAYFKSALAREDYYSNERPGIWKGVGARLLGLEDQEVKALEFAKITENRHPVSGGRLTPHTRANRIPAWDLNVHPPKSFSLLRALSDDENLTRIFQESTYDLMKVVEDLASTRVRSRGRMEDARVSNICYSAFLHDTSRPENGIPDPHTHMHCIIANAVYSEEDRKWKALKIHDIIRKAPFLQSFFHATLAHKTAESGYPILKTNKGWEIEALSDPALLAKFSTRTATIEKVAKEKGITSPKAKAELGARTRASKRKGLTAEQLRKEWDSRLTETEREMVQRAIRKEAPPHTRLKVSPREALDFAEAKLFERSSVISRPALMAEAMRFGIGDVLPAHLEVEAATRNYIEKGAGPDAMLTSREVLREEIQVIQKIREGRSKLAPLLPGDIPFTSEILNAEQKHALTHVLHSTDRVTSIKGLAGTGKTTALRELRELINRYVGKRVFAYAPSATASRLELRAVGYSDADTIARLISDDDLKVKVKGKIILIDESSLLSIGEMAKVLDIAGESTRVILVGDTGQHSSVARDVMRLLEEYSDLSQASLTEIQRQKSNKDYLEAVKAVSSGDVSTGFALLEKMGAIVEIEKASERHQQLAKEYWLSINENGETPLVVSPTILEGQALTQALRAELASHGKLGKERSFLQYRQLKFEEAEKGFFANYKQPNLAVQFHQKVKGINRGSILDVSHVDQSNRVWLKRPNGSEVELDLTKSKHFQVFEKAEILLAKGDHVRITRNGSSENKRRLFNGAVHKVEKIGRDGKITLSNGAVLGSWHGHIDYGYVHTSFAAQGKTHKTVFISQSTESGRAVSAEQFYVSISRGTKNIRIFVDDRNALKEMVARTSRRTSALEFIGVTKKEFMKAKGGEELLKRYAIDKAKKLDTRTHAEKVLAARGISSLKKPEGMGFEAYVQMRRANAGPDGRSRSKGSGPSKPKKQFKGYTIPKRVEMRIKPLSPKDKSPSKTDKAKSRGKQLDKVSNKFEAGGKRLKSSLQKALPKKSSKPKNNKQIGVGDKKLSRKSVSQSSIKRQQARKDKNRKQQRIKPPTKKVQTKIQTPVIRRK